MERFVDIHTHMLPGVDDGAPDLEHAMELLRMAWEDGTGAVILTPHYRGRYRKNTPEQLRQAFDGLQQSVKKELPEMELFLGSEAGIERELTEKLLNRQVLSLNGGNYVLLEFHSDCTSKHVVEGILELLNCGYIPVIAHAERYDAFCNNKHLADEVIRLGALIQINAGSITGSAGFATKCCCARLLKKRNVHFIASDAHDTHERTPLLSQCYRRICKKYGEEYGAALFWENARAMLAEEF